MNRAPRTAAALLAQYAQYHRDQRNIQTHLLGVPMVVLALSLLLSAPTVAIAGWGLTPAWLLFVPVALWMLTRGSLGLGLATTAWVGAMLALAHRVPAGSTAAWLGWGLGLFVLGRGLQFAGHYYEGRRPPFNGDPRTLLVAPLFVTMEALAPLGLFRRLGSEVERRAGPTHLRNLAHPAG